MSGVRVHRVTIWRKKENNEEGKQKKKETAVRLHNFAKPSRPLKLKNAGYVSEMRDPSCRPPELGVCGVQMKVEGGSNGKKLGFAIRRGLVIVTVG